MIFDLFFFQDSKSPETASTSLLAFWHTLIDDSLYSTNPFRRKCEREREDKRKTVKNSLFKTGYTSRLLHTSQTFCFVRSTQVCIRFKNVSHSLHAGPAEFTVTATLQLSECTFLGRQASLRVGSRMGWCHFWQNYVVLVKNSICIVILPVHFFSWFNHADTRNLNQSRGCLQAPLWCLMMCISAPFYHCSQFTPQMWELLVWIPLKKHYNMNEIYCMGTKCVWLPAWWS